MNHGITTEYLRKMADQAKTKDELNRQSQRVDRVFDVAHYHGLITTVEFQRLYRVWIGVQSAKYMELDHA